LVLSRYVLPGHPATGLKRWWEADGWIEGTTTKPCDENLATQIEEGYIRLAPFRKAKPDTSASTDAANGHQQKTWRLLGAHMSSFVVYVDSNTAWLLSDDFYGKISSTVYQRITAGSHLGGYRLVRGYTEGDAPETKTEPNLKVPSAVPVRPKTPPEKPSLKLKPSQPDLKYKRRSMPPPSTGTFPSDDALNDEIDVTSPSIENARRALERKMSSFGIDEDEEGDILEGDMKGDYDNKGDGANNQAREIDHLILVTHGIGQRLSMRMESVNFVHGKLCQFTTLDYANCMLDVNVFRKTLKSVYSHSTGLQALNKDLQTPKETKNCRIQVLPVCWRHLVDFPQKPLPPQGTDDHDAPYPSLQDITVEGVPAVRGLIADLALDVLLYQSPQYRTEIERVVLSECERIVSEFKRRNPNWRGKVSLVGHSLGSAIFFDLLEAASFSGHNPPSTTPSQSQKAALPNHTPAPGSPFTFPIHSLFALGSPIALFCLLRGQRLVEPEVPRYNLYNIFHPTDPISYRIEPLIAPQTARIKPQALPYTKKNFLSAASGWSGGVGESIQQGVSGWWRGVASKMLSRSMGIDEAQTEQSAEGMVRMDSGLSLPDSSDGSRPSTAKKNSDEGTSIPNLEGLTSIPPPQAVPPAAKDALSKWNPLKRVDYAIQEGTFEISLIASIASHLGYWADEDVAHFLLGQVLSGEKEEEEIWLGEREEGDISGQVESFGRRGKGSIGAKRK
jgi:hypothetical protein